MQTLLSELVTSIVDFPTEFVDIASNDPLSGLLILVGALFVGGASLALGYLTLGAVVDLLTPPPRGHEHRPAE